MSLYFCQLILFERYNDLIVTRLEQSLNRFSWVHFSSRLPTHNLSLIAWNVYEWYMASHVLPQFAPMCRVLFICHDFCRGKWKVFLSLFCFSLFCPGMPYFARDSGVCTCQQILDTKYKKIVSYIVRLYTPYATLDIAPRNSGQIIPTVWTHKQIILVIRRTFIVAFFFD